MSENRALELIDKLLEDASHTAYDVAEYPAVAKILHDLWVRKEAMYGMSWAKSGILGYWTGDMRRKIHRVDPGFRKVIGLMFSMQDRGPAVDEHLGEVDGLHKAVISLMGTLGDIANYAMMGVCLLASLFPDAYEEWVTKTEAED